MSDTGGWSGPDPKDRPDDTTPPGGEPMPPAPPPPETQGRQSAPPPPGQPYQQQGWGPRPGYGKPGVIPLRPLAVGEILDGAIATMRREQFFGRVHDRCTANVTPSRLRGSIQGHAGPCHEAGAG